MIEHNKFRRQANRRAGAETTAGSPPRPLSPSRYPSQFERLAFDLAERNDNMRLEQTQPTSLRCDRCRAHAEALFSIEGEDVCGQCVSDASGIFRKIDDV